MTSRRGSSAILGHYRDPDLPSQAPKRRKLNPASNLTPVTSIRTRVVGVRDRPSSVAPSHVAHRGTSHRRTLHLGLSDSRTSHVRGRPRFDGDMVSQDALPRTITLVKQMEPN